MIKEHCDLGRYTPHNIFTEMVPCANVTCENNATCDDSSGRFHCNCLPGFSGEFCKNSEFGYQFHLHNE